AVLVVLVVATVSPAAVRGTTPSAISKTAAHKCLVMTGSGDPAFVRNFNPYTATGLPAVPWLARTWKWSNGNKTLTLNLAKNVKWSDGKPLTSADVVYSLKGGNGTQSKVMDIIGYTRPDTNIASISASGKYAVVLKLKTIDSQFIATTLNGAV